MSLKVELMFGRSFLAGKGERVVYTTGAFLVPMKIKVGKKERFVWVVSEFNDDSYLDGEFFSPDIYAHKLEKLIREG